jgi:AraC-like DNA-binding protein
MNVAPALPSEPSADAFRLQYLMPAPELRPYVSAYNFFTSHAAPEAPFTELFWPRWANVHLTLAGDWEAAIGPGDYAPVPPTALFGVTSHPTRIRSVGTVTVVGFGITPLGWARLLGRPASAFVEQVVPFDRVVGDEAEALRACIAAAPETAWAGLLDDFVRARLAVMPDVTPAVATVHRLLLDCESGAVDDMAAGLGITTRQLTRLSARMFGLPPKLLLRRTRFLRALALMALQRQRQSIALEIGEVYHDHSHFIRDCRRFLGMTPSAFFAHPHPLLEASMKLRQAVVGAPMQALHTPDRALEA